MTEQTKLFAENKYHIYIHPFDIKSESAIALKDEFNKRDIPCAFVKKNGSKVRNAFIINWGSSVIDKAVEDSNTVLNTSACVTTMLDKRAFYTKYRWNPYVPSVCDYNHSYRYLNTPGNKGLIVRTDAKGSRGDGTHYVDNIEQFNELVAIDGFNNLLVTQYYPKDREFRIHIMNGEIILIQEKRKKHAAANDVVDWKVRKPDHFSFCRIDTRDVPDFVKIAARRLISDGFSGDFAGLDIGFHSGTSSAYIYEANSAPGIEGTDIGVYVDAICKHYQG